MKLHRIEEKMMEEYSEEKREELRLTGKKWTREFLRSKYSTDLTNKQIEEVDSITESFIDNLYSYFTLTLEDLIINALEEICLDILPRKVSAEISFFKALVPVLSGFLSFLSKKGILKDEKPFINKLHKIHELIIENASNPQNWGMAKSFVMDAMKSGVDMKNEDEFQSFLNFKMLQHNFKVMAQNNRDKYENVSFNRGKLKIGRNQPCPCGSGKKYKKCCFNVRNLR